MTPLNSPSLRTLTHFVSIADLAKRMGITARALRHYQERGLIKSHRLARNMRAYDLETVAVVETIVALRDVGLPIKTIGEILALRAEPLAQARAAQEALKQARSHQERRITRIDRMLEALGEVSGASAELLPTIVPPARRPGSDPVSARL